MTARTYEAVEVGVSANPHITINVYESILIEINKYLQDDVKILDGSTDLYTALPGYTFHNIIYQRFKNEAYI